MRKIIALMHISLDGFTAGPNGELDWALVDDEMYEYVAARTKTVDTALYGRVTYHMMQGYWPSVPSNPQASPLELEHAHWYENVSKIVFSKTLSHVEAQKTKLVKDHIAEEITTLKQQPGGDMMIFGSPSIVHTFVQLDLIDEYRLTINPIVLGSGIPLFKDVKDRIALKLVEARKFPSGVVGLHYQSGT